jgi:hypothetical protein
VTALFNIGLPILAVLLFLLAVFFLARALSRRVRETGPLVYGVGRQELRQAIQVDLARGVALLIVGLILVGVLGLRPLPAELEPGAPLAQPTPAPDATMPLVEAVTPLPTPLPAAVTTTPTPLLSPTIEPTPTSPLPTPTATATATETPTPEPPTAVVDSPNGLWLRETAGTGGAALENLPHNTVVVLLDGRETVDDLDWQQVRAPSGNEGWVAVDFLIYRD